jgi:hypothetical protein
MKFLLLSSGQKNAFCRMGKGAHRNDGKRTSVFTGEVPWYCCSSVSCIVIQEKTKLDLIGVVYFVGRGYAW